MRTIEELKKLGKPELQKELMEMRNELVETRFNVRNNQAKNSHAIKNLKKYIAQILTVLNNEA